MRIFHILLFLLAKAVPVCSQPALRLPPFAEGYLDVSVNTYFSGFFDASGNLSLGEVRSKAFVPLDSLQYPQGLLHDNDCRIWLRCRTDSLSRPSQDSTPLYWFFNLKQTMIEGFYVDDTGQIRTFEWGKGVNGEALPTLFLLPFESSWPSNATWYFRIRPFPFRINDFSPRVMTMRGWRDRSAARYYEIRFAHNITVCLTGIILFVSLFTFLQWALYRRPIYIYYSCFLLACISNLYRYEMEFALPVTWLTAFLTTHGDYINIYLGHAFYFLFINKFLSLKWRMPGLYRIIKWTTIFSFSLVVLHFILFYLVNRHDWVHSVYYLRFVLLSVGFYSLIAIIYQRPPFYIFIFCGGLSTTLGAAVWIWSGYRIEQGQPGIPYANVAFYMGLMIETFIFLSGLGYQFKISEESKRIAQFKLQDERERLTRDLHDDVGSTLNSLALMSELAIRQMEEIPKDVNKTLHLIKNTARDSVLRISDIVWSVNPNIETMGDLVSRMRNFTFTLFSGTDTRVRFLIPKGLEVLPVSANRRWQLYLIFKEATNNVSKYASASLLRVEFKEEGEKMSLSIRDNGNGFDTLKEATGNGLRTMQERAQAFGGTLTLHSALGAGAFVEIEWLKDYTKV